MSFRDNLQYLRSTKQMTQEQLAMLLGVSRQSVTKWEAEKSYPEVDKLIKICQIFEVSLDDLVTGDVTQSLRADRVVVPIPSIPVDSCGYDEQMRSFSLRVATGVALCVFGIAAPLFAAFGLPLVTGAQDVSLGVGIATMLVLMAAGFALVVFALMGKSAFEQQHPYVLDFYTEEDRRRALSLRTWGFAAATFFAFVACAAIALLMALSLWGMCAAAFFVLAAVATWFFVYSWLGYARVDIDRYNQKNLHRLGEEELGSLDVDEAKRRVIRSQWERSRKQATITNSVILASTCCAVILLFTAPPVFFIPWIVGAVLCAILRTRERNRVE